MKKRCVWHTASTNFERIACKQNFTYSGDYYLPIPNIFKATVLILFDASGSPLFLIVFRLDWLRIDMHNLAT